MPLTEEDRKRINAAHKKSGQDAKDFAILIEAAMRDAGIEFSNEDIARGKLFTFCKGDTSFSVEIEGHPL